MVDWSAPLRLAQKATYLQAVQELCGFRFDIEKARALTLRIRKEMQEIEHEVLPQLPPRPLKKSEEAEYTLPAKPFKQDGTFSVHMLRFLEKHGCSGDASLRTVQWNGEPWSVEGGKLLPATKPMELGNQEDIKNYLLAEGWSPSLFNLKKDKNGKVVRDPKTKAPIQTTPKMQENGRLCPNLEAMSGPLVRMVVRWMSYRNRLSVLEGWLANPRLAFDGRLTAGSTGVTNTFRQKHTVVTNVPKNKEHVLLGREFRELFTANEGQVLVGYDASALEDRIKGALTWKYDGGEYARKILAEGYDPHQENADIWGIERSIAKNGTYCVPMDTRCLSRTGWKTYEQLEVGEEILAYDAESDTKKWTPVLEKHYFEEDEVFEIRNRNFSVRATSDHRWFTKKFRYYATGGLNRSIKSSESVVATTKELNTSHCLIVNAPLVDERKSSYTGALDSPKRGTDWTSRVLSMSCKERVAFLEGFMIADGYYGGGKWQWNQNKGELYEAALTATYLVHDGAVWTTNRTDTVSPMGVVKLSKKSHVTCQRIQVSSVGKQPVWCVTTALGSWVIRQGDQITITGNCLSYGGSAKKLASVLKVNPKDAERYHETYWSTNAALKQLDEALGLHWESNGKKYIVGIDGRKVYSRARHGLVNLAIQSTASIIMDYSQAWMDRKLGGVSLVDGVYPCYTVGKHRVFRVMHAHDEYQYSCDPEVAEYVGKLGVESIKRAGEFFKLKVPLLGEYNIGPNWASTH
jgi:hypothetical protein